MSEPQRRATRRNMTTQPIQGNRAKPATIKPSPITPDELAWMIDRAREERETTERKAS